MALNPFREALSRSGLSAFEHDSSFKPETDQALARFQAAREDLERQVKRGDLTLKVAREKARNAAAQLREELTRRAEGYSPVPRVFFERLAEADKARRQSRERQSIEGLQRETNRLLRLNLVEQQLQTRAREFEGRAFTRAMPGGQPAPTLDGLLAFHEFALNAGDDAAAEWGRRQLESMRTRVIDPADQRRIDLACDRPDVMNPRIVASYMEALQQGEPGTLEEFVRNAMESQNANACVAAFLLAREVPEATSARWVRNLLSGLGAFPDAALATLRGLEAEAREADASAAEAHVDYALAVAEAQVNLAGVEAPSAAELARQARADARPLAKLGEPIGLAPIRKGCSADDSADHPEARDA